MEARPEDNPPLPPRPTTAVPDSALTSDSAPATPTTFPPIQRTLSIRSLLALLSKKRERLQRRINTKHLKESSESSEESENEKENNPLTNPKTTFNETEKKEASAWATIANDQDGHPALRPATPLVPLSVDVGSELEKAQPQLVKTSS